MAFAYVTRHRVQLLLNCLSDYCIFDLSPFCNHHMCQSYKVLNATVRIYTCEYEWSNIRIYFYDLINFYILRNPEPVSRHSWVKNSSCGLKITQNCLIRHQLKQMLTRFKTIFLSRTLDI